METLLNALTALGYLEKKSTIHFELNLRSRNLINDQNTINLLRLAKAYIPLFNYSDRVKYENLFPPTSKDLIAITTISGANASMLVKFLLRIVPELQSAPWTLLDIGCGQGEHLIQLSLSNPRLKCIGIDLEPSVIKLAQDRVKELKLDHTIRIKKADMRKIRFDKSLDMVTLFSALRGMSMEEIVELIKKIYVSLRKDGYLIIHDFPLENNRTAPVENVLFDMRLVLAGHGAKVLQVSEFEAFKAVGFRKYVMIPVVDKNIPIKDSVFFIYQK